MGTLPWVVTLAQGKEVKHMKEERTVWSRYIFIRLAFIYNCPVYQAN
jgi:hypothetical protein